MGEERFDERLKEESDGELLKIITRYISYRPELVDAALDIACGRGVISYDLKMQLADQITRNFNAHSAGIKQTGWESSNAFTGLVKRYTDDEIYNTIEDPSEIVIDVYHAVLVTAKERELITEKDFREYYSGALIAGRSDDEIRRDEWVNYVKDTDTSEVNLSEAEIEEEKHKYWKCPFCNQLVGIEMDACWNCQAVKPEIIQHPEKEEVIKEYAFQNTPNLTKIGLGLIGGGIFLAVLGFFHIHRYSLFERDYITMGMGIVASLAGIYFTIRGMSKK